MAAESAAAIGAQNESAKYNLAQPFSHDRSFIPMFVRL